MDHTRGFREDTLRAAHHYLGIAAYEELKIKSLHKKICEITFAVKDPDDGAYSTLEPPS